MRHLIGLALLTGACGLSTGDIDPMEQQSKLQAYASTRHFEDESAMRATVEGTVPRERDLSPAPKVSTELVELGHEKFNQICTPCHGLIGDGKGSVAHKMSLRQPPSLHDARRRGLSSEWIYRVITEGFGMMPRFTTQLDAHDRWAVVAYVRALQHSQDVAYDQLSPELKDRLDHPVSPPTDHDGAHGEHGGHEEHGAAPKHEGHE